MFFDAIVVGHLFGGLPPALAIMGALIGMIGAVDFFVSLFSASGKRGNRTGK